jgi:hypothetical protein
MTIDDEPLLTLDECLAVIERGWDVIEQSVLEHVAAEAVAAGFAAPDVELVVKQYGRLLREGRAARLATAKQMLEAHATSFQ